LASAEAEAQQAYGGWLSIWLHQAGGPPQLEGELLAVEADTAWILTLGGTLVPSATGDVVKARLEIYDPDPANMRLLVFAGILSTISHGRFLLASVPVWALGGYRVDRAVALSAIVKVPDAPWARLKVHARYPQGLPPGFRGDMIDPKPL
jgi:hypothetical protein